MPPQAASQAEDEELFEDEPWIESPITVDYGTNVVLGKNVFINFNCTILDTCKVTIGDRCLLASNVSLFSGTHPLDPEVRNGTKGPELGAEIHIEEDCWLGGNVTVLPGVRIGKGSTVGAGSVVTKVCFLLLPKYAYMVDAMLILGECTSVYGCGGQSCAEDSRCSARDEGRAYEWCARRPRTRPGAGKREKCDELTRRNSILANRLTRRRNIPLKIIEHRILISEDNSSLIFCWTDIHEQYGNRMLYENRTD